MAAQQSFGSSDFQTVANGLVALHRQIMAGNDDSPEADLIRDNLDEPLNGLDPAERERSQWLSEDCYSISEPANGAPEPALDARSQQVFHAAFEALRVRQWDRALALLRTISEHIAPALLSFLRGTIWHEAGYPLVAEFFLQHACHCDPANANYRALYRQVADQSLNGAGGRSSIDVDNS